MHITLEACVKGTVYRISSRNLGVGVYDGEGGFIGIREKFGDRYLFTEYHHDLGAERFGTVRPIAEVGKLPSEIPIDRSLCHDKGRDWYNDPATDLWIPCERRDLRDGEPQHGKRQGFVDEFLDGRRLPDGEYPYCRGNEALFKYISEIEAQP